MNSEKLDTTYKKFLLWKAQPMKKEDPQDPDQFCEKFDITKQEFISFMERPSYEEDLNIASLNWARSKIPELLHIAYNEAKTSKSMPDIEKFVNIAHELKQKKENRSTANQFNFFGTVNDQKLYEIARRTIALGAGEIPVLENGSTN